MKPMSMLVFLSLISTGIVGCLGDAVPEAPRSEQAATQPTSGPEKVVSVFVFSGRPQPPPDDVPVSAGAAVAARLIGLGPASGIVVGPDGAPVRTVDAPATEGAQVIGTERRFTVTAAGVYQVTLVGAPELLLVRLHAH